MENNQEYESIEAEELGQQLSVTESQDRAAMDSQVAVAKRFPRKLERVKDSILKTVTLDLETAESCGYALSRAGKTIQGPTIHLATIVAQIYGNMRIEQKIVDVGEKHVVCQASAWDLENNVATRFEVMRKITDKNNRRFSEDMVTVTTNAAMSIARRNAIFAVIPKPFWNMGYEAAQKMIVGDISDDQKLEARRKEVFKRIVEAYSVTVEEILAALKVNDIKEVDGDKIRTLIGYGNSIKEGDSSVDQIFRPFKDMEQNEKATAASESAINKLKNRAQNAGNS